MYEGKAAVTRGKSEPFVIEDVRWQEPRHDEILIKIVGTGVCHTDMVVRDQGYPVPLPMVLGHEGAGIVETVGDGVTTVAPGDHVVLSFAHCGVCDACKSGTPYYCATFYEGNFRGSREDGSQAICDIHDHPLGSFFFAQSSFGTYAIAKETNTVKIRKDVPLELMGPLGCGIQTGAGAVLNTLKPGVGSSIVIFGAGSVGISAAMAAAAIGCTEVIMVDLHDERLELAKSLGATHGINAGSEDVLARIKAITGKDGADFALECTGLPKVLEQAFKALRIPGKLGVVGAAPLGTSASFDINDMLFGRTVCGVVEGDSVPQVFIPQLIDLWRAGKFSFDKLVKFYDMSDINQAVEDSESGRVLKPIVRPS